MRANRTPEVELRQPVPDHRTGGPWGGGLGSVWTLDTPLGPQLLLVDLLPAPREGRAAWGTIPGWGRGSVSELSQPDLRGQGEGPLADLEESCSCRGPREGLRLSEEEHSRRQGRRGH